MRDDFPSKRYASRRNFLLSSGTLGIAALAGCTDGGEGGEEEAEGEGAGEAGAGLSDDGDDGEEGGEPGDEMLSEEFDPNDPDWENTNTSGG